MRISFPKFYFLMKYRCAQFTLLFIISGPSYIVDIHVEMAKCRLLLDICYFLKCSSEQVLFLLDNHGLLTKDLVMDYLRVFCYAR